MPRPPYQDVKRPVPFEDDTISFFASDISSSDHNSGKGAPSIIVKARPSQIQAELSFYRNASDQSLLFKKKTDQTKLVLTDFYHHPSSKNSN